MRTNWWNKASSPGAVLPLVPLEATKAIVNGSISPDEVLKRLGEQLKELADQIRDYTSTADKYFGLVGTLSIGILAAIARPDLNSKVMDSIVMAAPFTLALVLHYVAQLLTERAARVGIKHAIEVHLFSLNSPAEAGIEEQLARTVGTDRLSVKLSGTIYVLILVAAILVGGHTAYKLDGEKFGGIFLTVIVGDLLSVIALILASNELISAAPKAYRETMDRLGARIAV